MKTLSPQYISEQLFGKDKEIFYEPDLLLEGKIVLNNKDKIKKLNLSLIKLIKKEKYESAAIVRDRILNLKNNKK